MKRCFFGVLVSLAVASCATAGTTPTGTVSAGFGQTAVVDNLRVTPTELLEDSRCAADVQCVWEGRVRLRVTVDGGAGAGADVAELTLGQPTDLGGASLILTAVEPGKRRARSSAAVPTDLPLLATGAPRRP